MTDDRVVVVLGMHKSGTSLVASMVDGAGIPMVEPDTDRDTAYDHDNHWERVSTRDVNLALLGAPPHDVLGVTPPRPLRLDGATADRMRSIVAGLGDHGWGFKDPRTTLTYPAWEPLLPDHRIVAVHRRLRDLWPRFRHRGVRRAGANPGRAVRLVRRWREHNEALLRILDRSGRSALLISYEELMDGDLELRRLEDFLGRPVPDRRRPELHRTRADRSILVDVATALDPVAPHRRAHAVAARLTEVRRRQLDVAARVR